MVWKFCPLMRPITCDELHKSHSIIMTIHFLNMYNIIALVVIVGVSVSLKYAFTDTTRVEQIKPTSSTDLPEFNFYRTIEKISVPTNVPRRTAGKQEWLRMGVFSNKENAHKQVERAQQLNIASTVETDDQGRYAIWVGPFESRQLLELTRQRLMRAQIDARSVWRE